MGVGEDDRLREQRDTAWDALREIEVILRSESEDWSKLDGIGAIISNGPLDTAPGGPREDECERLRGEVERLRRGVSDLALDVAYAEVVEKPEAEVEIARLSEEVERLRTALASALASCEEAADGVCDCDGYDRCNTCPGRIARDAERAVEVLRAALAPVVSLEQEDNDGDA